MGGAHAMKRIPLIKFPKRHLNPSGSETKQQNISTAKIQEIFLRSEVPAPPPTTSIGGKASLQPKRTPVTDKEIEAVLLGGCF